MIVYVLLCLVVVFCFNMSWLVLIYLNISEHVFICLNDQTVSPLRSRGSPSLPLARPCDGPRKMQKGCFAILVIICNNPLTPGQSHNLISPPHLCHPLSPQRVCERINQRAYFRKSTGVLFPPGITMHYSLGFRTVITWDHTQIFSGAIGSYRYHI